MLNRKRVRNSKLTINKQDAESENFGLWRNNFVITTIVKDESDIEACLATLNAAAFMAKRRRRSRKTGISWLTTFKAHLAWVKSESWGNPMECNYRLLNHVVPPPLQENGHILDCRCRECQTAKFRSAIPTVISISTSIVLIEIRRRNHEAVIRSNQNKIHNQG